MRCKILSIANQKGGVGKTTTAINLSACLSAAERRVLLVDMDPQGNATSGLGFKRNGNEITLYDVIMNGNSIEKILTQTEVPFLSLCPSSRSLFEAEISLHGKEERERRLLNAISSISERYDYIIIDCPPSLGYLTLNALVASQSVIIPLQAEYYAMEGLSDLLDTLDEIKKYLNPILEIEGILLTMFDERTNLSREVEKEVREVFGSKVFKTVVPRSVKLSEAPSFGKPIILYDIKSKGAIAYLNLAKEILGK
ncbi:MAG: ParA family protein [Candidatus Aminicenantia bacterium]